MSRVKNEVGNKYGKLIVLERSGSKNGKAAWLCQCECGNKIIATGDSLRRGQTVTCGSIEHKQERAREIGKKNFINLAGKKFFKLTVLEPVGKASYGGTLWKCRCDCGNLHTVQSSNLVRGNVKSCGCLKSQGEYQIQQLLTKYNIVYETQYTPPNWKFSTGYKPFYDFGIFNSDNKLIALLEFNGEQHKNFYKNKNTWNNENNFLKTQRRDKEKLELCNKNNIPLFIIWYNDDIKKSLLNILEKLNLYD